MGRGTPVQGWPIAYRWKQTSTHQWWKELNDQNWNQSRFQDVFYNCNYPNNIASYRDMEFSQLKMIWGKRTELELRDNVEMSWDIFQSYLNELVFLLTLNFPYLYLSTPKTIGYEIQNVKMEFLKYQTMEPLLWFAVLYWKWNCDSLFQKRWCDKTPLQKVFFGTFHFQNFESTWKTPFPAGSGFSALLRSCASEFASNCSPVSMARASPFHDFVILQIWNPVSTLLWDIWKILYSMSIPTHFRAKE